ncbi:hypothetical protein FB567DRAFT_514117 [Paraphoma chrysanthemicola]|uniref:Uncharacterized protein n=1 Tax=Paraphoma chrysanthemicola TaxID=798071 RepID=A0A8K0RLN1_9PLEO|nr:hypothetical protein FB567DRAFT_514117 [Paraphoma chrysanthemicola]
MGLASKMAAARQAPNGILPPAASAGLQSNRQPALQNVPNWQNSSAMPMQPSPMPPTGPYNQAYWAQVGEEWQVFGAWRKNAIEFYEASRRRDGVRLRQLEQAHHDEKLRRRDAAVAKRAVRERRPHLAKPQPPPDEGEVEERHRDRGSREKSPKGTKAAQEEDAVVLSSKLELYSATPHYVDLLPVADSEITARLNSSATGKSSKSTGLLSMLERVEKKSPRLLMRVCNEAEKRDPRYIYTVVDVRSLEEKKLKLMCWILPMPVTELRYLVAVKGVPKVLVAGQHLAPAPPQQPSYAGYRSRPVEQQLQLPQQQQLQLQQQQQIQQLQFSLHQLQTQLAQRDGWPMSRASSFGIDSLASASTHSLVENEEQKAVPPSADADTPNADAELPKVDSAPIPAVQVTEDVADAPKDAQ